MESPPAMQLPGSACSRHLVYPTAETSLGGPWGNALEVVVCPAGAIGRATVPLRWKSGRLFIVGQWSQGFIILLFLFSDFYNKESWKTVELYSF